MSKATCPPCHGDCNQGRQCPDRVSFPLHRQVMPPESDSDAGYWWMFGIAGAAIVCFVLAVAHFARHQF